MSKSGKTTEPPWGLAEWTRHAHPPRCYTGHPALPIPGTGLVVWGGSCLDPVVTDAEIYIGFDSGMKLTERQLPWTPGHEVRYLIQDQGIPNNPSNFMKLIEWTAARLEAGSKVHAGCVGGHGRTGLFFAALVKVMAGEPDAIAYVRQHYCRKAVESQRQVDFLVATFGITAAEPRHSAAGFTGSNGGKSSRWPGDELAWPPRESRPPKPPAGSRATPLASAPNIWRRNEKEA
jgi:hypothetical protein